MWDPVKGHAWHNNDAYTYGRLCKTGDTVQCKLDKTKRTISFQVINRYNIKPHASLLNPQNPVPLSVTSHLVLVVYVVYQVA